MFDVTSSLQLRAVRQAEGAGGRPCRSRLERFPEIPTMVEAGMPGYEAYTWFGFVVPAGTPPDVVAEDQRGDEQGHLRIPRCARAWTRSASA